MNNTSQQHGSAHGQNPTARGPMDPTYPESPLKYFRYRLGIILFSVCMIILGKSNQPQDQVSCLEQTFSDYIVSLTFFYIQNPTIGKFMFTILQISSDLHIFMMALIWIRYSTDFVYPISLCGVGLTKIFLNWVFVTTEISPNFHMNLFPSIFFGQNFQTTYFFSGLCAFLASSCCELRRLSFKKLWKIELGYIILCAFLLVSMRLNYLMDIVTGLAIGILSYWVSLIIWVKIQKKLTFLYKKKENNYEIINQAKFDRV